MSKEIKVSGKQVFENEDELEEGYVEISISLDDLLSDIDSEKLTDWACDNLDLKHEDECVEFLEESGYIVTPIEKVDNSLDYIDSRRLEEIITLFRKGSWGRKRRYVQ